MPSRRYFAFLRAINVGGKGGEDGDVEEDLRRPEAGRGGRPSSPAAMSSSHRRAEATRLEPQIEKGLEQVLGIRS